MPVNAASLDLDVLIALVNGYVDQLETGSLG